MIKYKINKIISYACKLLRKKNIFCDNFNLNNIKKISLFKEYL